MYERPEVQSVTELAEGVFMASGAQADEGNGRCHFDRRGYNPGSDKCQVCSATNGLYAKKDEIPKDSPFYRENDKGKVIGFFKEDFKGCPDHMPESDS